MDFGERRAADEITFVEFDRAPEPRLVSHQREPTKPKPIAAQGDRPWMLGH